MVVPPVFGLLLRGQQMVMGDKLAGFIAAGGDDAAWGRRPQYGLATGRSLVVGGGRYLVDLAICHPIAAVVAVGARLMGWSVARCLAVAAVLDQAVTLAASRNTTAPARFLRLWILACRFRRRWPDSLAAAGSSLQRHLSVGQAGARASEETASPQRDPHDVAALPALARLPHRIEGSTVVWSLDSAIPVDPSELGGRLRGLSLIDPRILNAGLERRSDEAGGDRAHGWSVVVDFDIEPPPWDVSVLDRGRAFVSINPTPNQRDRHEGDDFHGNG